MLEKALELADSLQDLDDDPHVASNALGGARYCWEYPAFGRKGHNYDHTPERQRKRAYIGIKKKRAALLERNVLISRLHFRQSWPQHTIAKHLGISTRQVRRIVARWREIEGDRGQAEGAVQADRRPDRAGQPADRTRAYVGPPYGGDCYYLGHS